MTTSGFFLIHKPIGITSHDVVDKLRKLTGEKTIGHAGTLDPFAEGLLLIAIGREYTKKISEFSGLDKEYTAGLTLGKSSTTYDREGELRDISLIQPSTETIETALEKFRGPIMQQPPIFSAKKIGGKKAYELARQHKEVILQPAAVIIHRLDLISYSYPHLVLQTRVSKGTYIRSLAYDIGQELGAGAYLQSLIRTKIGNFELAKAVVLDSLTSPAGLESARVLIPNYQEVL